MKKKLKVKWRKFKVRIQVAWCVLFKYEHWFIVNLTEKQLIDHFKENDIDIQIKMCALWEYNVLALINHMHSSIDQDDLVLKKAEFEAKAYLLKYKV